MFLCDSSAFIQSRRCCLLNEFCFFLIQPFFYRIDFFADVFVFFACSLLFWRKFIRFNFKNRSYDGKISVLLFFAFLFHWAFAPRLDRRRLLSGSITSHEVYDLGCKTYVSTKKVFSFVSQKDFRFFAFSTLFTVGIYSGAIFGATTTASVIFFSKRALTFGLAQTHTHGQPR